MTVRLLIADDHGVLRAGLIALLKEETGMEVVGEADDENSAVSLAVEKRPDVVLMDLSMPNTGGIEATRRIKQLVPEARILILTFHEDKTLMQEAIRSGAMGYILKRAVKSELINAIHAVMRGELYLHPAMARLLFMEQAPALPSGRQIYPGGVDNPRDRSIASHCPGLYQQSGCGNALHQRADRRVPSRQPDSQVEHSQPCRIDPLCRGKRLDLANPQQHR